ncbi:MAG: prephenate dehydrogenase/arogenate dehydrogenase family protein [Candidatus Omnitrophica bacterium]|nr:prephenate dehydrogenase/arogenate dehydrogenase family protein [Candidatus Omnitrophota bacterium]
MRFGKVAIIGVGLIGGSIALAIKKRHLAKEVVGIFRRVSTLKRALRYKAIDRGTLSIKDGVKDADLIILATPVSSIPKVARDVAKYTKKGAVITDVGSTKKWIVERIEKSLKASQSAWFVGSHPMAGSEHAGVEFARYDLLTGSPCIVTKTTKTGKRALDKVVGFWKGLDAKVKIMDPATHDRSISLISHLPHLVAFALAGIIPAKELSYAAEGFKDTTRVASSDPKLWADIFISNKKEVLRAVHLFEKYLKNITAALSKGDYMEMVKLLKKAKSIRDSI